MSLHNGRMYNAGDLYKILKRMYGYNSDRGTNRRMEKNT